MGKQRKTWSPELKEQIVLAVLRSEQSVAELARQHGVAARLIPDYPSKRGVSFASARQEAVEG